MNAVSEIIVARELTAAETNRLDSLRMRLFDISTICGRELRFCEASGDADKRMIGFIVGDLVSPWSASVSAAAFLESSDNDILHEVRSQLMR